MIILDIQLQKNNAKYIRVDFVVHLSFYSSDNLIWLPLRNICGIAKCIRKNQQTLAVYVVGRIVVGSS